VLHLPPNPLPISIKATEDEVVVSYKDFTAEQPAIPPPRMQTLKDGGDGDDEAENAFDGG
jgi:hypothetical protein